MKHAAILLDAHCAAVDLVGALLETLTAAMVALTAEVAESKVVKLVLPERSATQ